MAKLFTTANWVNGTNIYEVNVRQYTSEGTLNAFAKHLPRLREMGIDVLWFMPLTPISKVKRLGTLGSYYAAASYTDINPEFGSAADFKALVKQAHAFGFKVLIDWVANHTGWDHSWTLEHPEYYKTDSAGNFYDHHGWIDVIDLNYENRDLWLAMTEAMQYWIDNFDIDGFRCDMAHLVPLDFWVDARSKLDKIKAELFWLGETEAIAYHQVFDTSYGWELLHCMEKLSKGSTDLAALRQLLIRYEVDFPKGALHLAFTSNHDENSHSGSEYERMGNAAKAFAVLTATWPGCLPLIYSGQELPNKKRLLFFDKDDIDWTVDCRLQDFYQALLILRKQNTALHDSQLIFSTH